ncbi:hypothetical protein D9615_009240 [Tricholomella constricta]|uniref:Uncharacterized protein n=1 Tax=Tricholomella constricta TaxID=117010 RepID=A0A8H5GW39_9AGAR|nr:hypothetical protein D9615_009240 [Tricholomella constricta]
MSSISLRPMHLPNVETPGLEGPVQEGPVAEVLSERDNDRSPRHSPRFAGHDNSPSTMSSISLPGGLVQLNLDRNESPALSDGRVHGGISTPRYQDQPSTLEPSSDLAIDSEWHTPMGYVAVDPFLPSVAQSLVNLAHANPIDQVHSTHQGLPYSTVPPTSQYIRAFLFDLLPRQIYLYLLLGLPSLYWSRVARIFEDAELSMPYIKKMVDRNANQWSHSPGRVPNWNSPSSVSPHFLNLKASWELFIDSLMREWKTLNLVSVLLLSVILTTLQLDAAIADPITRTAGLLALICSMMSLLYGCLYILRFNTMRRTHKAAEWAQEAQQTKTCMLWNVWVLLAMPSVWLSWSIVFFFSCVMSFVWRTGFTGDPVLEVSPSAALGIRIGITAVFTLGIVYFLLIVNTFRRYGAAMDMTWQKRISKSAETPGSASSAPSLAQRQASAPVSDVATPTWHNYPNVPLPPTRGSQRPLPLPSFTTTPAHMDFVPPSFSRPRPDSVSVAAASTFETVKIVDLRLKAHIASERPEVLSERDIQPNDWARFILDVSSAWDNRNRYPRYDQKTGTSKPVQVSGRLAPRNVTARFIAWWNVLFFLPRGAQAVLCEEHTLAYPPGSPAIYLLDIRSSLKLHANSNPSFLGLGTLAQRFESVLEGLERIAIYDPIIDLDQGQQTPPLGVMGKTIIRAGPRAVRVRWGPPERAARSAGGPSGVLGIQELPVIDEAPNSSSSSSLGSNSPSSPQIANRDLPESSSPTNAIPGLSHAVEAGIGGSSDQADPDRPTERDDKV